MSEHKTSNSSESFLTQPWTQEQASLTDSTLVYLPTALTQLINQYCTPPILFTEQVQAHGRPNVSSPLNLILFKNGKYSLRTGPGRSSYWVNHDGYEVEELDDIISTETFYFFRSTLASASGRAFRVKMQDRTVHLMSMDHALANTVHQQAPKKTSTQNVYCVPRPQSKAV